MRQRWFYKSSPDLQVVIEHFLAVKQICACLTQVTEICLKHTHTDLSEAAVYTNNVNCALRPYLYVCQKLGQVELPLFTEVR